MPRTGVLVLVLGLPSVTALAEERVGDEVYREPCLERDGVVGHRSCPAYGIWSVDWPAVTVTFGFSIRHLPRNPAPAEIGPAAVARTVTSPTGIDPGSVDTSYVVSEQIAVAPNPVTFFAFEVEFAPSTDQDLEPGERAFGAATHLVAGVRGGGKSLRFGAEIAGGIRLVDSLTEQNEQGVLEARLRGELSMTPWLGLGVLIGTSLLDRGDWIGGVSIAVHSNAFDGQ